MKVGQASLIFAVLIILFSFVIVGVPSSNLLPQEKDCVFEVGYIMPTSTDTKKLIIRVYRGSTFETQYCIYTVIPYDKNKVKEIKEGDFLDLIEKNKHELLHKTN